jgi:hypothetical protein
MALRIVVLQNFKGMKLFGLTIWPFKPRVSEFPPEITWPARRSRLNWFHGLASKGLITWNARSMYVMGFA